MDFIHVHDIARAVVLALDCASDNVPVNIGTGIDTTVAELARILIDAVGVDVQPQFSGRDVIASRRAADVARARDVLGFEASIPVRDGMTQLIRDGG